MLCWRNIPIYGIIIILNIDFSEQFVVWSGRESSTTTTSAITDDRHNDRGFPLDNEDDARMSSSLECGAIIPVVQVAGTATRRAVEPTWLTASNPKVNLNVKKIYKILVNTSTFLLC